MNFYLSENVNTKQTFGYFKITGYITVDDKTFTLNSKGKNNKNWISNIFNPKVEDGKGKSMYLKIQDGFDNIKGKKIYTTLKNSSDLLEVSFADRKNENIINNIDEKSFIKIGIDRETVTEGDKSFLVWKYNKYLTAYDAISYLSSVMDIGNKYKITITGRAKYQVFNGELKRNYELQSLYFLDGNEIKIDKDLNVIQTPAECDFSLNQNVIIRQGAVDLSEWKDGVATVDCLIYQKKKKDTFELIHVPMVIRALDESKKNIYEKIINKYFTVGEGTIRRINLQCKYNSGYVAGNVTLDELPVEALELIEDGLYSREEVFKLYANKTRVDEIVIVRPVMKNINNVLTIDASDKEYTEEDLNRALTSNDNEETIKVNSSNEDIDLLKELEGL